MNTLGGHNRCSNRRYVLAKVLREHDTDVVADGGAGDERDTAVRDRHGSNRRQRLKFALDDGRRVGRQDWLGRKPAERNRERARLRVQYEQVNLHVSAFLPRIT